MFKKISLFVFCIAINLDTHGMLRKTATAFMVKSKKLSEAITFLKEHNFSIAEYFSNPGWSGEKEEKVKLIRIFNSHPHNKKKTIISISTSGSFFDTNKPFNLSIDHKDLSGDDQLKHSNSETWYTVPAKDLLNLLEKKTPPGPTK